MTLQETLLTDMKQNIKDVKKAAVLKLVVAEIQREPSKIVEDSKVIKIIKKLIENEKELKDKADQYFILTLTHYLPTEVTKEEVVDWIKNNIDFSKFKNKMQAMKPIMSEFVGIVNGNTVKQILEDI